MATTTCDMKTTPSPRRRRIWPWILAAVLAPWLVLAVAAWSILTPARDLTRVRQALMTKETDEWRTQVQFDIGAGSLGLARTMLRFVPKAEAEQGRLLLAAVNRASVGVYERSAPSAAPIDPERIAGVEAGLRSRGWEPLVKVIEADETVLVCHRGETDRSGQFFIVVMEEQQCVLVYTQLTADELSELVTLARRSAGDFKL